MEGYEGREQTGPEKIKNFFDLTDEEEKLLIDRIEKASELVRVFVHPHILSSEEEIEKSADELLRIDRALRILASAEVEKFLPTFVMVEHYEIDKFKQRLSSPSLDGNFSGEINNDIYLIPTFANDPSPMPELTASEPRENDWRQLIEKFKKIGIKKISIGGLFLFLPGKADNPPRGCVGAAINALKKDFNVELSSRTYSGHDKEEEYEKKRRILRKK